MKLIFWFLPLFFMFSGCSNKSITCCDLQNEYNEFNYLKTNNQVIPLDTIKGNASKEATELIYIYDLTNEFAKKVNDYFRSTFYEYRKDKRGILNPNINKYCNQVNLLMNSETNQTVVKDKFHILSKEWIASYQKNLKVQLKNQISFTEYNGCSDNTRRWRNSFLRLQAKPSSQNKEDFEMYRKGYEDCLRGSIKKHNKNIKNKEIDNAK